MSPTWDRESAGVAGGKISPMRVGRQLKFRSGLMRGCRGILILCIAGALAWWYPLQVPTLEARVAIFGAAVLYVWLIARLAAVALGVPRPRPRCPRCAHKVALESGMNACPTCKVSFADQVRRDWRNVSPAQSPWLTRPHTLRTGQFTHR